MTTTVTQSPFPFETLIKGNAPKSRDHKWYPTSVEDYRKAFKIDTSSPENEALLNNICCNMQYLELLEKELSELELSAVLRSLTIKNYVITAMSILEGLFTNIVKTNGLWNMIDEQIISETTTNEIDYQEKRIVIRNTIIEKIPKQPVDEMKLVDLIKKLNKHHKALKINHTIYPALQRIRKLRNKIHLSDAINNQTTDYMCFNDKVKTEMQTILYEILTNDTMSNPTKCFEFLNPNYYEK